MLCSSFRWKRKTVTKHPKVHDGRKRALTNLTDAASIETLSVGSQAILEGQAVARTVEELLRAKAEHQAAIQRMKDEDELFPLDPIHDLAIKGLEGAIGYIERQIEKLHGS